MVGSVFVFCPSVVCCFVVSIFFFSCDFLLCFFFVHDEHGENEHRKKIYGFVFATFAFESDCVPHSVAFKLMYMCVYTRIRFLKMLFSLFVLSTQKTKKMNSNATHFFLSLYSSVHILKALKLTMSDY